MKKLLVYVYPASMTDHVVNGSDKLLAAVQERGFLPEIRQWDGKEEWLAKNLSEPSMIRSSNVMRCPRLALVRYAQDNGHFVFYENTAVTQDGTFSSTDEGLTLLYEWLNSLL